MTRSHPRPNPREHRARAWMWAVAAIVLWVLLAANSASAQSGMVVPEFVLAQVLGPDARPAAAGANTPAPSPAVHMVANRMRQHFEDQLVAGVTRPSVELEVHFDFDSDVIHEESTAQIEAAAAVLSDHFPDTRFRVAGYADAAGSADYNLVLSERRARAVWEQLVEEYGVGADRLEMVGFGEDDSGDANDAQRRRVELQILRGEARN